MQVTISDLPENILKKLPLSIKSFKNIYDIDELPVPIRYLVEDYLKSDRKLTYKKVYDITPELMEIGDFKTINNLEDLILQYLKNYFMTSPDTYPFDATYSCKLKQYLHTKDVMLRQSLIMSEAKNLASSISLDLNANIDITDISVKQVIESNQNASYNVNISIKINNRTKTFILSMSGN